MIRFTLNAAAIAILLGVTGAVSADVAAAAAALRETLSLDGAWTIVFDRDNHGERDGWQQSGRLSRQRSKTISVPSCWEETEQDYEGVAWYTRTFRVPPGWRGKHIRLGFDAVNYIAEVWLNDEVVGRHEGGYTPFEFDVTDLVELDRENRLVVRVVGPAVVSPSVDGLVRNAAPHWRGAYVGGIWQSVWLTATALTFVQDIYVEPKLTDGSATVHAELANSGLVNEDVEAVLATSPAKDAEQPVAKQIKKVTLAPGKQHIDVTLSIPNAAPWSPASPHLYLATVTLRRDGKLVDQSAVRFGMREFTVRDNDFYLNGQRLFIKGAFWEGFYPSTLAHPRDPEIVRREIRLAKEAGLNLLRPWRMPPVPMTLDVADEMGILMVGSPPIECMGYWPEETPELAERWTSEMRQMVRRDRNHPAIICWETSNEIIRRSLLRLRHPVSLAARELDPTRLIIDESGGSRAPWGAHFYLPRQSAPQVMLDQHIYLRSPVDAAKYDRLAAIGSTDKLTFISEVGYGSLPDLPKNMAQYRAKGNPKTPDYRYHERLLQSLERVMQQHRLGDLFPDASALCRASQEIQAVGNKLQVEAMRTNPAVDGYCLHAYTDGDWVLGAGVLDVWREPKRVYKALAEANAPLYLAIACTPQNVYAERGTKLRLTAVNDGQAVEGKLTVAVSDDAGKELWSRSEDVRVEGGIRVAMEESLKTDGWHGRCVIIARLEAGGKSLTENRSEVFVLGKSDLAAKLSPLALIDAKNQVGRFLQKRGVPSRLFQAGQIVREPVIVVPGDAYNETELTQFVALIEYVERGGTAVWLRPPATQRVTGEPIYRDPVKNYMMRLAGRRAPRPSHNWLVETGVFPLKLESQGASGNWISVNHYLRPHAVFAGLPTEGFMGQVYQNVTPVTTLRDMPGEAIAGCVSWDHITDYRGPQEAWHGTDVAVVPHGKGRMILSTLQLVDFVDQDPVAEKLLLNLLQFAQSITGEVGPATGDLATRAKPYIERYRALRADAAISER